MARAARRDDIGVAGSIDRRGLYQQVHDGPLWFGLIAPPCGFPAGSDGLQAVVVSYCAGDHHRDIARLVVERTQ